tara:strand:+ start:149 stop:667 length:519 start_codon:yes stop_codon:yes gene_type:complete
MKGIAQSHFVGIQRVQPHKERIVHAFDLDDTITQKPDGFNNRDMSKDAFFDASRAFAPDDRIVDLLRMMHQWGDSIAICTARPSDRLTESFNWLRKWNIPFDVILVSTGVDNSGNTKQHMLKYLRKSYRMVGTLIDDSPYNIEGARLQRIKRIHVLKNCEYWDAHPEVVVKV